MTLAQVQEKFMRSQKVEDLERKLEELFATANISDPENVMDVLKSLSPTDLHLMGDIKDLMGEDQYHLWIGHRMKIAGLSDASVRA